MSQNHRIKFSAKIPLSFQEKGVQMERGEKYREVGTAALIPGCIAHKPGAPGRPVDVILDT